MAQADASLVHYYKKNQEKVTAKSELQVSVIITNRNKTRDGVVIKESARNWESVSFSSAMGTKAGGPVILSALGKS